jgi:hypothetical protein
MIICYKIDDKVFHILIYGLFICEKNPTAVCNDDDSSNSYRYVDIDSSNGKPQSIYAQQDEGNQSLSSSSLSSVDSCASDQLPANINGRIQCMGQGECYSEQFEGKEVKHCNFMMSGSDE